MSYILDALKKTEAENDPDVRASLAIDRGERRRQRVVQGFVTAALLINAVVLLWLFVPRDSSTEAELTTAAPAALPQAPAAQQAPAVLPTETVQVGQIEPAPLRRLALAALPAAVRREFPQLVFSTHVYADDPALRAVVVNGQRLTEGNSLGGLYLNEITENGVVFATGDYLVDIAVLDDWQN
ncbi:MAG: general secretion pathway protein GspB [Gammaproteobacteria bacterium]|nr:general secretion pathway protein GspB [Gammaproteobacteria bacterium]